MTPKNAVDLSAHTSRPPPSAGLLFRYPDGSFQPHPYEACAQPAGTPVSVRDRAATLRAKLETALEEVRSLEVQLIETHVEGVLKDYTTAWALLRRALDDSWLPGQPVPDTALFPLDALTRSALSHVDLPLNEQGWANYLRRNTSAAIEEIDGPMTASFLRVQAV